MNDYAITTDGLRKVFKTTHALDGLTMRVPTGEGGSALPSFYSSRMRFDEGDLVPFRSLDSVADLLPVGDRVVMKVDVEGTEDVVLGSGQAFLKDFRPDILCEVLPDADGAVVEDLLAPAGLRTFLVTNSRLEERPAIVPDADHRDSTHVRLPRPMIAAADAPRRKATRSRKAVR